MIEKFRKKMQSEGRNFKWFHKNYIKGVTYAYFIQQLNGGFAMGEIVKDAIQKFLNKR